MLTDVIFWIIAAVVVGAALAVVLVRDIFYAALFLILSFFAVAGIYITLNADFLAAVQILVYAGAIGVLIIFAIMLTRNVQKGSPFGRLSVPGLAVSLLVLTTIIGISVTTDWGAASGAATLVEMPVDEPTTSHVADVLFSSDGGFVLPFEIASVLLLAAIIGAVALARERKK